MISFRLPAHWWQVLALALILSTIIGLAFRPRPVEAGRPDLAHYQITLDVDYQAGTYAARQIVSFTNQTNEAWTEIVFAVPAATLGRFQLTESLVQGQPVAPVWSGSVLRLPVAGGLAPGQAGSVTLAYAATPPRDVGRFGQSNGILALGGFYPVLNVYRQGPLTFAGESAGWTAHQYVDVGDAFYSEAAEYDVTVRLAQPATVAANGTLIDQSGPTWHFQAPRVREFALAVSDRYQLDSIKVGRTVVAAYYLPEHAAAGQKYLHVAAAALEWLNSTLGEFPYPQLSIAEMAGDTLANVGQEYPGLIFMSGAIWPQTADFGDYFSYLLTHEVGHQWFYAQVGNDQLDQPWVDEALVTWLGKHWQTRVVGGGGGNFAATIVRPVDSTIYEFGGDTEYFSVVYRGGSAMIEELYQTLGDRTFFWALQNYVSTFQHRIATPAAFIDLLQEYTARNLNPIVSRYLRNAKFRAPESPRVDFWTPPEWSGLVPIVTTTGTPIARMTLYIDDRAIWSGPAAETLQIESRDLIAGDHLVTVVFEDAAGNWSERSRRITRVDPPLPATGRPTGSLRPIGKLGA